MDQKFKTQDEKLRSDLAFGAGYYGVLELQNRRASRNRTIPSGRTKFSTWENNPIERVLHFRMYTPDDMPCTYMYSCFEKAICTPSGSKEWTEGYIKLYKEYHLYDEDIELTPVFVFTTKRHIELEVLEAFKPTIPRSFSGKLKNNKKIFYDLPAPSEDAPEEIMNFYLGLKDMIDKQNEELKDFVYDEDAIIQNMCPDMNDFVKAGHCFEKK